MKRLLILMIATLALFAVQTVDAAEWKLDKSHTAVKFKVKHILTNVWGEFTDYDAELIYDADNPSKSMVKVTIDAASIDTGNEKRDNHLRSADFFDVEKYPHITFESTDFKRVGDNKHKMIGNLTIKNTTQQVELMVDGPTDPINFMGTTKVAASAQGTIDRTSFGLTWNRVLESGGLLVGEEVTMVIDAELDKVK